MSPTARFAVAATVVVAAIVGLIVWSLSRSTAYYRTPAEIAAGPFQPTQTIRVAGKVFPGSISHRGDITAFTLAHGPATLDVTTQDVLPDTFQPGVDVVAEGRLAGSRLLSASNILVKCPSKFEAKLAAEGR